MGGSVGYQEEPDKNYAEEESVKDVAKFFRSEASKNRVSGDRILYARKKLTPLKKGGLTVQPRSIVTRDKRNFKVTFLNVEKLELVKMYSNLDKEKAQIANKTAMNLAISMGGKSKLI